MMAQIDAWGAYEVARVVCDLATTTLGVDLEVNRVFIMASDGRILTRSLDVPTNSRSPYTIAQKGIPASERNMSGLLAYVRTAGYRIAEDGGR